MTLRAHLVQQIRCGDMAKPKLKIIQGPLKLDLGCGNNKKEGFTGVDRRKFASVDVVAELTSVWPWDESSVDEVHMSHVLEHFTGIQRVHIFNELWRVLKPGCAATIITPHWNSNRAYGDFTHQWPPVSEMLYYYLSKDWRATNAPDNDFQWNPEGYKCDFEVTWGNGMHPQLMTRNQEYQQFAMTWYKEAIQDLHANLKAKK